MQPREATDILLSRKSGARSRIDSYAGSPFYRGLVSIKRTDCVTVINVVVGRADFLTLSTINHERERRQQ
eukprot:scaffold10306_cov75-Skeletonema_marinoi.AAC.3